LKSALALDPSIKGPPVFRGDAFSKLYTEFLMGEQQATGLFYQWVNLLVAAVGAQGG